MMNEEVELVPATRKDEPLLANLLELYQHDLSEYFPVDPNADGRFGYPRLSSYWPAGSGRFPFLIRSGDRVVGFALVTHGSPVDSRPDVYDVAEFFVLRRHRRTGIAQRAAHLLWTRLGGRWTVRVLERNAGALQFWRQTIRQYAPDDMREEQREGLPGWMIFTFAARGN